MQPPRWVQNLVEQVALDYGIAPPVVNWQQKKYELGSHGHESKKTNGRHYIFISAGTRRPSQKCVVLHEMAHRIVRDDTTMHGPKFWRKYIELCRQYNLSMRAVLQRDGDVPAFKQAYEELGGRW